MSQILNLDDNATLEVVGQVGQRPETPTSATTAADHARSLRAGTWDVNAGLIRARSAWRTLDAHDRRDALATYRGIARRAARHADHARKRMLTLATDAAVTRRALLEDADGLDATGREVRALRRERRLAALEAMDAAERLDALEADPTAVEALALAPRRTRERLAVPGFDRMSEELMRSRDELRYERLVAAEGELEALAGQLSALERVADRAEREAEDFEAALAEDRQLQARAALDAEMGGDAA